jgi:hypothetical protein
MLTPRNFIILFIVLFVVSLVSACVSLIESPTGGVTGRDSFGTRTYGFRGLYETLEELGVPVERDLVPPDHSLKRDVTFAIVEPDPVIVTSEPAYLHTVAQWVKEGGSAVVIPSLYRPKKFTWPLRVWPPRTPLEELSLPDVEVGPFHARGAGRHDQDEDPDQAEFRWAEPSRGEKAVNAVLGQNPEIPVSIVRATVDGELADRFPHGLRLAVPAKAPRVITELSKMPGSRVRAVLEPDGQPQILAAIYKVGSGTVGVLADANLAQNAFLGREDNALLAASLLADSGHPVISTSFITGEPSAEIRCGWPRDFHITRWHSRSWERRCLSVGAPPASLVHRCPAAFRRAALWPNILRQWPGS